MNEEDKQINEMTKEKDQEEAKEGNEKDLEFQLTPSIKVIVPWESRGVDKELIMKIGDVEEKVEVAAIFQLAFLTASPENQEALVPIETKTIREYWKMVKIVASKDIKQGEEIVAKATFSIPELELCKGMDTMGGYTIQQPSLAFPLQTIRR